MIVVERVILKTNDWGVAGAIVPLAELLPLEHTNSREQSQHPAVAAETISRGGILRTLALQKALKVTQLVPTTPRRFGQRQRLELAVDVSIAESGSLRSGGWVIVVRCAPHGSSQRR